MSPRFSIEIEWERLDCGPPEERAAFGAIGVRVENLWLTDAHDAFVGRVRQKVHISGYLLAQWLAWNWWRLRWEPKRQTLDWTMAHRVATIGGGYVWPNLVIVSDGKRVLLQANPTPSRAAEPLRYVVEAHETMPVAEFQNGVEQFIEVVLQQLRAEGIRDSNLERIWTCVGEERRDSKSAWYRRLEAALGFDPDEADEQLVEALIADGEELGKSSVAELAAGTSSVDLIPSSRELKDLARTTGHEVRLTDMPRLSPTEIASLSKNAAAWAMGEAAAKTLRNSAGLGDGVVSNKRLADLAGVGSAVLTGDATAAPFSFALSGLGGTARVVMRSPFVTSRRFDLARLIGDRFLDEIDEPLLPIMRSHSYRQKRQRAFAAEFLCPFDHARPQLDVEFSEESQEFVAAEYQVSSWVVRTQLVNNRLLEREALENF